MTSAPAMTALVLAGSRAGGDPLAVHAGVSHKALIDIGGQTMLQRVLAALDAAPEVARIVIVIEKPEIVATLTGIAKPVTAMTPASGPSASVAAALAEQGTPMFVTTADHPLLDARWVAEFIAGVPADADAAVALAHRSAVNRAAPESQRTWLRFADGDYSGCNLFLFRRPAAQGLVQLWQQLEVDRKRPVAMLKRLGFSYALRYRLGRLSLDEAMARLGELSGTRVAAVSLTDGRAAIDVDKPADLELARRLVQRRG